MRGLKHHWPTAVVLGLGQNGLATVRALGRQGIPVIGIDRDLRQYTARTRYCKKILSGDFKRGDDGVIQDLLELGACLPEKGVLFPSGDHSLQMVSDARETLAKFYSFTFPSRDIVRLTLDKKRFYGFAEKMGFPIPQTFFPNAENDCQAISRAIRYPCIIKPIQPNLGWRRHFPDQKLFEAHDRNEFLKIFPKVHMHHRDLIVQERIPGKDSHLSFSLTYFDPASRPLCMFTGRKLRQYPPRFGSSSLAESRWDPRISDMTIDILTAMQYTGYGSVEFIWDSRDRRFKIIEASARTWFPHGISSACGMNIEYIAYCDQAGLPRPVVNNFREAVKWIHEERDIKSSLEYIHSGDLSMSQWVSSYKGDRTYAISAWDDPAPLLCMLFQLVTVPWRRIIRKTHFIWMGRRNLVSP